MAEVITNGRVALIVLKAGLVLDRSALAGLTKTELDSTVAALRSSPHVKKRVTIIDSVASFFTASNMLDLIKANDDSYKLIAEKANVTLRDEQVQAIQAAEAAQKAIETAMIPPLPPYTFATIPADWSVAQDLNIIDGPRGRVRRRRNNQQGNGTSYALSLTQLKRLWTVASVYWQTKTGVYTVPGITSDGYTRSAVMELGRVQVGCQSIQRYELEQLALHLKWDFPTTATK